ncbi:MAG: 50S ribosomal protein L10 [Candidatus Bipolaricaulota bacterium]|nr:50S ribosomal protein L10 [Candidatus Bipolaricaulota bacterium]MCS7274950.1 50S ribosomal protein L10 [Candidatus Bipolaricaulota bacterium]MDW8110194.1 50S ribosomal protein L10 [Candidatus Bipolaricaulota bacterium]MDW8329708.1 50S ribosomal protein L10 [Candidatus Bipolaricaulota bacterium]
MPTAEKEQIVAALEERLKRSQGFVLTNFEGLTASEMSALRRELRQKGLEYLVVKNALAQIAVQRLGVTNVESYFRGPTGLCIGYDDGIAAFKAAQELTKKYEKYKIKGGVLEGRAVSAQEALELAKLPGRHELLGMVVGALQAPIQQMVGTLNALLQNFVSVLDEVRKKRESQ